jgi:hypothetical protein
MAQTKYIFITGGVVSSLGKGIAAASIGALFEARGLKVSLNKLDPYINVDPGTMSPFQHGEVFVTNDGTETDLDLGHYERFVRFQATKKIILLLERFTKKSYKMKGGVITSEGRFRLFLTLQMKSKEGLKRVQKALILQL